MPLLTQPVLTALDSNGDPISGALLYSYESGTSTPKATYSEETLTTPHANPIVADAAGRFDVVYLDGENYKLVLKDAGDVTIWTADPVSGVDLASASSGITDTATSERLVVSDTKINMDNPLLVGDTTSTPDGPLHIFMGSAGAIAAPAGADHLTIEDDADVGMSFLHPDADEATINFGSASEANYASLKAFYNAGTSYIALMFGATEVFRFRDADNALVVQERSQPFIAVDTGTTLMVFDDTTPQNDEGDPYIEFAFTPYYSTSTLEIDVSLQLASSAGGGQMIAALFQDAVAAALHAASVQNAGSGSAMRLSFKHSMPSPGTSEITFKVHAGNSTAGTTTFNGSGGARLFGGIPKSTITVREIL